MYIGAVTVLPTYVDKFYPQSPPRELNSLRRLLAESKSGKQALCEVRQPFVTQSADGIIDYRS